MERPGYKCGKGRGGEEECDSRKVTTPMVWKRNLKTLNHPKLKPILARTLLKLHEH